MKLSSVRARVAVALASIATKIAPVAVIKRTLMGVDDSRGWWSIFSGAIRGSWQADNEIEINQNSVFASPTVFACTTLIAGDCGKLRAKLMEYIENVWRETTSPAFSPVLRKPNRYQTWQLFIEQWVYSLMSHGNTYVLKVRDARKVVVALYVLDPTRCRPLVSDSGDVFYALMEDFLSTVDEHVDALPASEIIHDRVNCLFHPLVGLSPIFAYGLAATKAQAIDKNAARFFANQSQPGGVLTAPTEIGDATAARLKEYFEKNFTGENAGKVAVLGDGLEYKPMTTNAVDAQLIEQLKWSASQIAAIFHVPGYLVGAEPAPANTTVEALRLDYYGRCLQRIIEGIENALDDGLGLGRMTDGRVLGIELDLDGLIRMDTTSLTDALSKQVGAGILAPNEARRRVNERPVAGGESPLIQQQNYSLAALARRDASDDPFGTAKPPAPAPAPASDAVKELIATVLKNIQEARNDAAKIDARVTSLQDSVTALKAEPQDDEVDLDELVGHFNALAPIDV